MTSMYDTVVITGANRGIGLSLCKYFKQQGSKVYGLCRHTSDDLDKSGAIVVQGFDVNDHASIENAIKSIADDKIDLLINNAGILRNEVLGNLDFQSIEDQLRINALGPLKVTECLLHKLRQGSKVAMITSRMGSIDDNTSGGRYGYRMSKVALNIASVSLAHDLRPKGVSMAIIHPGLVGTDMIGGFGDITPDQAASRIALRIDDLNLSNSGTFWHSNGETLPW